MSKYSVEGKSRKELRKLAKVIRKILGIQDVLYFPAVKVLEILQEFDENASFEIVTADELQKGEHAVTDIVNKVIKIREDVYYGACDGNGRDRMTIVHEFAHFIMLCCLGFQLTRTFDEVDVPAYKDPEWQAKCLAGELMMDSDLICHLSASEIVKKCGVSVPAAKTQMKYL